MLPHGPKTTCQPNWSFGQFSILCYAKILTKLFLIGVCSRRIRLFCFVGNRTVNFVFDVLHTFLEAAHTFAESAHEFRNLFAAKRSRITKTIIMISVVPRLKSRNILLIITAILKKSMCKLSCYMCKDSAYQGQSRQAGLCVVPRA